MDTRTGVIIALGDLQAGVLKESVKMAMNAYGEDPEFSEEQLKRETEAKEIKAMSVPDYIPIDLQDVTKLQKSKMQVSKFDNRSVLGRKFTKIRKIRRKV